MSTHTPDRGFACMNTDVKFIYCKVQELTDSDVLALVRFTSYDDRSRVLAVEQVTYQDSMRGFRDFETQVTAALECGVDVAVMTFYDLDYFPIVESMVTQ